MTTETNTNTAATPAANTAADAKAPAPKTVCNDMSEREVFPDTASAFEYLAKCGEEYSDFATIQFVGPGIIYAEDGEIESIDEDVYSEDVEVMVSVLKEYVSVPGKDKKQARAKAIVMAPAPTIDSVLANEEARQWLIKVMRKEISLVSNRPLRNAENLLSAVVSMPTTLAGYITSQRESNGSLLVAFDDYWKDINDYLSAKVTAWKRAKFKKLELRKAFESRGFALEWYENLEDRGEEGSLIVAALRGMITKAQKDGKDVTLLNRWLDTRDQVAVPTSEADDSDEAFDFDAFTADLLADPAPAAVEPGTDKADADGNLPIG